MSVLAVDGIDGVHEGLLSIAVYRVEEVLLARVARRYLPEYDTSFLKSECQLRTVGLTIYGVGIATSQNGKGCTYNLVLCLCGYGECEGVVDGKFGCLLVETRFQAKTVMP